MRKLAMLFLVAMMLSVSVSVAYAEPPDPCFDDDFEHVFLNPQPLPPWSERAAHREDVEPDVF